MEKNGNFYLNKEIFYVLLDNLIQKFGNTYDAKGYKHAQLFGFGNYDPNKPSLKKEFEKISEDYINGKYLYNKMREASAGAPVIRISKMYQYIYLTYLGHKNINEFLEKNEISQEAKEKQIILTNPKKSNKNHFYVCYYYSEDSQLNKGQVFVYNNWETLEMKYYYSQKGEEDMVYFFTGNIVQNDNFIHFNTKFFNENKKIEGAKFVFSIGKTNPGEHKYLLGTYAGFDKYDRAIAGKIIFKKFETKEESANEVHSDYFDPIICQELYKERIIVESNIEKKSTFFSDNSPYATIIPKIVGKHTITFQNNNNTESLNFEILPYDYTIVSLNDFILIDNNNISAANNWQILNIDLSIKGIFYLVKVSIYIKVLELFSTSNKTKKVEGDYIGVDVNNNISSGKVIFI